MEVKLTSKFHLIFILDNLIQNMINDNVIEKEENLKELVIKLLKERNLSDFELLDCVIF